MKRQLVLGILFAAGALTMSVNALQQAAAGGQAPRVVEVEKLKDNLYMMRGGGGNSAVFITSTGVVVVVSRDGRIVPSKPPRPPAPPPPAPETPDRVASADVDSTLEIPVAVQERILVFEGMLDRPYHEILGVAQDADRKALKKAYFALSKELHPDRFFRRNTGAFGKRLERGFGSMTEALVHRAESIARAERSA